MFNVRLPESGPTWFSSSVSCNVDHGRDADGNPVRCPDLPPIEDYAAELSTLRRDPWPIAATVLGFLNAVLLVVLIVR